MPKIIFITTDSITIPWHLKNLIFNVSKIFEVNIVGNDVSKYSIDFPEIYFFDIKIKRKLSIYSDLLALINLFFLLHKLKPDITHSFFPKAGFISAIASYCALVPFRFHTFTGQIWLDYKGFKKTFYKLIDKFINLLNTECLTDSLSQSKLLYQNNIRFKRRCLTVLGSGSLSGVDINFASQGVSREKIIALKRHHNIKKEDFIYCFLARKTRIKGAIDMLNAFKIVGDKRDCVKLFFIGPDEDGLIKSLEHEKKDIFKNVINIDTVVNKFDYLSASDVLCIPSAIEGFGTIVLDAAAVGVPAVGYRVVGLVDSILDCNTGLLSEPFNIEEFSKHMIQFKDDIYLQNEYGINAKNRVLLEFDSNYVASNLIRFYESYIKNDQ